MDRYRRLGMEYRFHDDTAPAARPTGPATKDGTEPASGDEPGAVAHTDDPQAPDDSLEPR